MAKTIAGYTEPKSKPLSPIYTYEVDLGKGSPLYIEANRVDQTDQTITFLIEYTDYNLHVAGFCQWKSYRLLKKTEEETQKTKEASTEVLASKKKSKPSSLETDDLFKSPFSKEGDSSYQKETEEHSVSVR